MRVPFGTCEQKIGETAVLRYREKKDLIKRLPFSWQVVSLVPWDNIQICPEWRLCSCLGALTGLKASLQLGQQPKLSLELVGDAVLLLHPPGPGHGAGELKDQSSVRYVSVLVVTWGDFHDIANGQSGPRVLCHSTGQIQSHVMDLKVQGERRSWAQACIPRLVTAPGLFSSFSTPGSCYTKPMKP
ncbi:hypothetical protein Anapl_02462 [Anas platyrhynchos]|uniref:Uncharacterized protein n=1 Tax=Anas platyrhynchos TaxID=8839 RepID=R0LPJ3_ANAPL|nr:hypothetical protein Anapl_02462 [Anas platyrhynchos]